MGASQSEDALDANEAVALQQQRTQFLLLQRQIQEARVAQQIAAGQGGQARTMAMGGMRPVEQPGVEVSHVIQNPAHVHGKTLAFVSDLSDVPGAAPTGVRFRLDATAPGVATLHRSATLSPDAFGAWQLAHSVWSSPPVAFGLGLGQAPLLEFRDFEESETRETGVSLEPERGGISQWPLLVEIRVEEEDRPLSVEWTMCRVLDGDAYMASRASGGRPKHIVDVVQQHFSAGGVATMDVLEVFGSELSPDGYTRQDCIVCQTEPRDTMVLPCRHMCLCGGCSEYIRTRVQYHSYKCPICRKRISRMMRVGAREDDEPTKDTSEASAEL